MTTLAYRRPPDVAVVDGDEVAGGAPGAIYLARLPNGPLLVLEGSAAAIWRAAVQSTDDSDLVERVSDQTGANADGIRADVEGFLADLLAQGLLEHFPLEHEPTETGEPTSA